MDQGCDLLVCQYFRIGSRSAGFNGLEVERLGDQLLVIKPTVE